MTATKKIVPLLKLLTTTAQAPIQAHHTDAGWDIFADLGDEEWRAVQAGEGAMIPTGIAIECPEGYYYDIRGRSSTWSKLGLLTIHGLIDSGYQGELHAFVFNPSRQPIPVKHGQRICQLVFHAVVPVHYQVVQSFDRTLRGDRGYGSTGE